MREKQYLNNPYRKCAVQSINGEKLNPHLLNIVEMSQKQKQKNIMNVIRTNDFSKGYETVRFDITGKGSIKENHEDQIRTLIATVQDSDTQLRVLNQWLSDRKQENYNAEQYLEDLLQ